LVLQDRPKMDIIVATVDDASVSPVGTEAAHEVGGSLQARRRGADSCNHGGCRGKECNGLHCC
jgi:hypothetical protein